MDTAALTVAVLFVLRFVVPVVLLFALGSHFAPKRVQPAV